jgi:RND family efflux transporter MFP subunit
MHTCWRSCQWRWTLGLVAALAAACSPPGRGPVPGHPAAGRPIALPGSVEAFADVPLYAAVPGRLRSVPVAVGDRVATGQILATLEQPEIARQYAEAEREVVDGHAAVLAAEAEATVRRNLLKGSGGVCAQEAATDPELARKRAPLVKAEADLQAARARLQAAEIRLRQLAAYEEYGHMRAPFAGTVTRRLVGRGARVAPAGSAGAQPIVVMRRDGVRVTVDVPARDAVRIAVGAPVTLAVPALAGRGFPGRVTRVTVAPDPSATAGRAEIELPNADGILQPGMSGALTIDLAR